MFSKILIANRGEIAVRVMRTCRELGIGTVAVYSDLDRDAAHTRYADEAYAIGGESASESYLNTEAILDVVARSAAEAVHPGYGFFSENAEFARALTEAGCTWIGPPPEAIDVMGDKMASRRAVTEAGVAAVPGTLEPIAGPDDVIAFGTEHGWPVALKAAYGGGGRGIKIVERAEAAAEAFESATREAEAYFGRPEAYLERYLTQPRHIEIQILADAHGHAVWLGERDCSTQRRHQKLIEESPAPGLSESERTAMGEAAVKITRSCGYTSAGTVEMLYQDGEFFFLEMNTRLQVEHCVTEMCTSLDLVAEQIRIAAGEELAFSQEDITRAGHAIELRINAEDPAAGFLPSPGQIQRLRLPAGPMVRWDGGYDEGDRISPFYDNLIGKLIVWAPDRDAAINRAQRALDELVIDGVPTTIPAHRVLLDHPDFRAGGVSTTWLETEFEPSAFAGPKPPDEASETSRLAERAVTVEIDGKRFSVTVWLPDDPAEAPKRRARSRPRAGRASSVSGDGTVAAPMQGTIVKVNVGIGDEVAVGDALVVLEAMKMENSITAEVAGTVAEVRVVEGDSVGTGDVLVVIA